MASRLLYVLLDGGRILTFLQSFVTEPQKSITVEFNIKKYVRKKPYESIFLIRSEGIS